MDFGIARMQSADATGGGTIMGTPNYMAPEQVTNGAITPAVRSLLGGLSPVRALELQETVRGNDPRVLYQVLTTEPKPLRTMAPSIPAGLERVVGKAMNKAPEDRYQNARQLAEALVGIRAALSGRPRTQRTPTGRGCRRRRRLAP